MTITRIECIGREHDEFTNEDGTTACHHCEWSDDPRRAAWLKVAGTVRSGYSGTWPVWARQAWTVTLRSRSGKTTRVGYFGGGAVGNPSITDVMESLALDARLGGLTFEDYCDETGDDADSIKALSNFRECKRMRARLERWLTAEEFDFLLEA
jgi:hypothetical protein